MQIGIFARTYSRPTFDAGLDAIAADGIRHVQFNFKCVAGETLPATIAPKLCDQIHAAFVAREMTMVAISGTFNMIHPDRTERASGMQRLRVLAEACPRLNTPMITLCTGTRDTTNMWRRHPDNDHPEAWQDLLALMREAITIADDYDLLLGVEPEVSNVIDSATRCRRLLDELGSPRVKVVMDGANLFQQNDLPRMSEILHDAFEQLGPDIGSAHAKDLARGGAAGNLAAGTGLLDYDLYLRLLEQSGYDGPLVLHNLEESQVAASVEFLNNKFVGTT